MKALYIIPQANGSVAIEPGADSSILRPAEPVFIEEPNADWESRIVLGVRISRLGFHIPPAHALRHYDSIGALHLLWPLAQGAVAVPPLFRDRAIAPGEWQPLDADSDISLDVRVSTLADGSALLDASRRFTVADLDIARYVALASKYMSLKTGDIILLGPTTVSLGTPAFDTRIEASINGHKSLDIRIK